MAAAGAAALLALCALLVHVRARRRLRVVSSHLAQLEADVLSMRQIVFRIDASGADAAERQADVEARLALLAKQQQQLEERDHDTAPYLNAIRDAQAGVGIERLMSVHGLNRGEAELIVALHGSSAQPA